MGFPTRPRLVYLQIILLLSLTSTNAHKQTVHKKTQASALDALYRRKYFAGNNPDAADKLLTADQTLTHQSAAATENQDGRKEGDRIWRLPGQPPVKFGQYGGYVTVDKAAGRALYYYLVEAEQDPQSSPLLLWLNGGPGCSSLGYGAMQELGPFRVLSDGKSLSKNNFAWNKAANVLFLESPAGVGFSYSNRTSDYAKSGDKQTAIDNLTFLLNWVERFPEYKKRDFFIAGESYAGHYVPQLAHNVLQHNKRLKGEEVVLNLKGIMIGNAVINDETDLKGMIDYFWTHALISDQARNSIFKECDFSPTSTSQTSGCQSAMADVSTDVEGVDIYNIYAPVCQDTNLTATPRRPNGVVDPCSTSYVYAYLNLPQVQKALHANITKLDHDWESCSGVISNWVDGPSTVIPLLREVMASGLRVWVFSGDVDGRVPVTSTRYSINTMKLKVKTKWHPWFVKEEVGGYTEAYEGNMTFATVRGAGHEVPRYQPKRALSLIKHFLSGNPFP